MSPRKENVKTKKRRSSILNRSLHKIRNASSRIPIRVSPSIKERIAKLLGNIETKDAKAKVNKKIGFGSGKFLSYILSCYQANVK